MDAISISTNTINHLARVALSGYLFDILVQIECSEDGIYGNYGLNLPYRMETMDAVIPPKSNIPSD
jgi:hypothetical protein